jgi:hypothetical protein
MHQDKYQNLVNGPIDEIDAAIFSSDMFIYQKNIADFREKMARWERGLKEAESIISDDDVAGFIEEDKSQEKPLRDSLRGPFYDLL